MVHRVGVLSGPGIMVMIDKMLDSVVDSGAKLICCWALSPGVGTYVVPTIECVYARCKTPSNGIMSLMVL